MSDAQLDDLKQFITDTVSQQLTSLDIKIDEFRDELRGEIAELRQEMRDGFAGVGVIIEDHNDRLDNHQTRITKLEQTAA